MGIQKLQGDKKNEEGLPVSPIKDLNTRQYGPSSDFDLRYHQEEMDKLPLKQPTGE